MSDDFAAPSTSTGIVWADHKGELLLVTVHEVIDHLPTQHTKPGEKSPAVRADVAVLDGENEGTVFADTLIFPKVLQSQVKNNVGGKVLGRLGQGLGKPGQSKPWILNEANEDDKKVARAYISKTVDAPF